MSELTKDLLGSKTEDKKDDLKEALDREGLIQAQVELFKEELARREISPSYLIRELKGTSIESNLQQLFDDKLETDTLDKIPSVPDEILESMLVNGHLDDTLKSADLVDSMVRHFGYQEVYESLENSDLFQRLSNEIPEHYEYIDESGDLIKVSSVMTEDDLYEMERQQDEWRNSPEYEAWLEERARETEEAQADFDEPDFDLDEQYDIREDE